MQPTHSLRRVLAGLLAFGLVAAACGDDDSQEAVADGPASDTTETGAETGAESEPEELCTPERAGGDLTVATFFPLSGLDPFLLFGTGAIGGDVAGAFYDTVMRHDARTGEFSPHLAESLEGNEDDTVWTLTLRDEVTFGNGDPMTTADVAAQLERMKESRVRAAGMAALVSEIEIVDDREMVVTLSTPFNFPYMMATELGWIPNSKLVEERGEGFHVDPVGGGAGPYEVERISEVAGEEIVLSARDDYWGEPVCIETIRFVNVPGDEATLDAFTNDEVDTMFVGSLRQADTLGDAVRYAEPTGTITYVLGDQGITGADETAFQDVRVREAMQLAIDYDTLNERLYDGLEPRTTSALVPEESDLYSGVAGPPSDPERAEELVKETITEGVWDGSFTYLHEGSTESTDHAVLLEAFWEAVGMDVTLEVVPSVAARVIAERNFEVSNNGFAILPTAPWTTLSSMECDNVRQRTGFCDPEMDAALAELRAAGTMDENREAMGKIQEVFNRTFPVLVTEHGVWGIAAQPDVHGLQFGADNTAFYDRAWIEQ